MNRVPKERVESELAQIANSGRPDKRFYAEVMRRLLALEDALTLARPVIEQYARQLSEDNDGNYVWLQWRDDAIKALEALAALGGEK